jgi:hypothetical protein
MFSHIAARLSSDPRPKNQKSSNGVKYRSLCGRCNSKLLGAEYDPALIDMARQVSALLTSPMMLPGTINVRVKPQRVARAVLGHIAAQGVNRYDKGDITMPLRDYLCDRTKPLPPSVRLCYWSYPHRSRVLMRDAAIMTAFQQDNHAVLWLMKSFPLAFAALWGRDFRFEGAQPRDFDAYTNAQIDDIVDLPIDLFNAPPEMWPEAPTPGTMLLVGREAIAATISPARGKVLRIQ